MLIIHNHYYFHSILEAIKENHVNDKMFYGVIMFLQEIYM